MATKTPKNAPTTPETGKGLLWFERLNRSKKATKQLKELEKKTGTKK